MKFTATDLDFELEHLRIDVANVDVLRKMTRAQERRVMGEVFVWWQKAKQIDGYLENCYTANNITFNQTKHEVNFRPLLRLVTTNNISSNDLDTWSLAFSKILDDVNKSPKHYADEPAEKIANFVQQSGGKRALTGYYTSKKAVNEAAEIKRAISQAQHDAKEERAIQRAFEDGQTAQLVGDTLASCRLKLPARRNAWERGWLDTERKRAEQNVIRGMSETEKADIRQNLSAIKTMLETE